MQIFDLPKKAGLAHLDAQYFHNDPKPGIAEHVIKIQYRTKRGDPQKFIIPVTDDTRNINRSAKRVMGADAGLEVKKLSKQYNKDGVKHFFGFRQVCFMENTKSKNVKHFKKKSDANTFCWVFVENDHLKVQIMWAGEVLTVEIRQHKHIGENTKQSMGIGYYNPEAEITQFMEMKHASVNDGYCEQSTVDTGAAIVEDAEESEGSKTLCEFTIREYERESEIPESDSGSNRLGADELIACIAGHAEADRLRASYSSQVVDEDGYELPPEERGIENRYTKSIGRDTKSFKQRAKQYMVDNNQWGDWAPEKVHPAANGIGTTFSVFRNV
jgi:hypothetical protein